MSAALEPRGATSRWRRAKRDKGAPKNPPKNPRDAAPDGPSEAHRTDATGDFAHPRARRGREASSDDSAEARLDGTEPFANDDSTEGSPAGPLSASELTASSCSGGSCASEDGDGSAATDEAAATRATRENARREDEPEEANPLGKRAFSDLSGSEPLVAAASPDDEWPAVGLGARETKRGDASSAPAAAAKWRCAGDWPCGACAHANSGWRARCARCGAEKEKNGRDDVSAASVSRSRDPAGSNLSADGAADGAVSADIAAFPPLGAATTDGQAQRCFSGDGPETSGDPETTSDAEMTERRAAAECDALNSVFPASLAGASTGAFASAPPLPPGAIPLEALERAFLKKTAAETAADSPKGVSEDKSSSKTRFQTTPFRWDDEADATQRDDAPLPPLPWGMRLDGDDGDAWTPAPDPSVNERFSDEMISRAEEHETGSVIDALREALRLERDARDAAVRAGVAVARERDFDALREMAENVASHAVARVAADLEARHAADAAEAERRRAELEKRLAEVQSDAARHEASNASLSLLAERLERRLEAMSARCVALEGETARLASLESLAGLGDASGPPTSVENRETLEDANATTISSKREEAVLKEATFPRHRVARRPPAREDVASVFGQETEKNDPILRNGAGLVKRARSKAADYDHGTYFEAQPLSIGFGSSASVFGAVPDGVFVREEKKDAESDEVEDGGEEIDKSGALGRETELVAASKKSLKSAKQKNRRRPKKPNAAERRAIAMYPTGSDLSDVASVAEEIRLTDLQTFKRRFRERVRWRKTKVSFANALDAKNDAPLPRAWARAEGFFDAETARAAFLRPSA